jgi:hypothetical protein
MVKSIKKSVQYEKIEIFNEVENLDKVNFKELTIE